MKSGVVSTINYRTWHLIASTKQHTIRTHSWYPQPWRWTLKWWNSTTNQPTVHLYTFTWLCSWLDIRQVLGCVFPNVEEVSHWEVKETKQTQEYKQITRQCEEGYEPANGVERTTNNEQTETRSTRLAYNAKRTALNQRWTISKQWIRRHQNCKQHALPQRCNHVAL